jgi:hypothetical protein
MASVLGRTPDLRFYFWVAWIMEGSRARGPRGPPGVGLGAGVRRGPLALPRLQVAVAVRCAAPVAGLSSRQRCGNRSREERQRQAARRAKRVDRAANSLAALLGPMQRRETALGHLTSEVPWSRHIPSLKGPTCGGRPRFLCAGAFERSRRQPCKRARTVQSRAA